MSVPDVFEAIDVFILDRVFQPIADWWQELTGKSNFWIAKSFCWVWLILTTVMVIKDFPSLFSFALMASSFAIFLYINMCEREDSKQEHSNSRTLNGFRLFFPHGIFRIISVVVAVLPSTVDWMVNAGCWLVVIVTYFIACTPKPPSRLRAGNLAATGA